MCQGAESVPRVSGERDDNRIDYTQYSIQLYYNTESTISERPIVSFVL